MKVLILDDEIDRVNSLRLRLPNDQVTHASTVGEFIEMVGQNKYDLIMLDHDLGYNQQTGVDAAKFLANNQDNFNDQEVVIHSCNLVGVANMLSHLKHCTQFRVYTIHFAWNNISREGDSFQFRT